MTGKQTENVSKTRLCSRSVREKKLKKFSLAKNVKLNLVNCIILPPLSVPVGTFLNDRDPKLLPSLEYGPEYARC